MTDIFERLSAPFPPEAVSWRVGSSNKKKIQRDTGDNYARATKGMALAFIDARDVMDRLDDVCGPGGWQCRYPHANGKTVCEIGIKADGEWVWKADGAGDTDVEKEKGALSDAFKRAAVRWGIGRYLYHLPSPWVDLDDREQISEAGLKKLRALLTTNAAPPKAEPDEESAAVMAACVAIDMCKTEADLTNWSEVNKQALDQMTDAERAKVRKHYAAHLKTVRSTPFDQDKKAA